MPSNIQWIDEIGSADLSQVGGKAASLGELQKADVNVPDAFVVTAGAYREVLTHAEIDETLADLVDIDIQSPAELTEASARAKELIIEAEFPSELRTDILEAYGKMGDGEDVDVAVRSSATAEDLPSIAAHESALLRVDGEPVFGRMDEIAPLDCGRRTVEVPSLTDDGIKWSEVDRLYEHPAENETLHRITTSTGRQITVTPDHSLVVLDEDTLEPTTATVEELEGDEKVPVAREIEPMDSGPETIDVTDYIYGEDVLRGDGGVMIDNDSLNETIQQSLPSRIEIDDAFAYFLGLYVAEGSTNGVNEVSITNSDEEVLDRAIEVMDRIGLWNRQAKNKHSYRFHCKSLVRFLHTVAGYPDETEGKGRLARNKRVPEFVFGWDRDRIGQFLRGCFDGDGTVGGEIVYGTTSERLVEGLARLLELLGIDYRIGERDGVGTWSDSYRIFIPAREARTFRELVGFESERKIERLDELIEEHDNKAYYPEFARTVTVSEGLSERIRNRFEATLPTENVTVPQCPDCGDDINKSSPYDGRDRWYCPDCESMYYEDAVDFETEERYRGRNGNGQFEPDQEPWNKARMSGTYSQRQFNERVLELGVDSLSFDASVAWEDIKQIEAIDYDGPVYDFCVPGVENFAAGRGSVITHNTASFAGQQETYLNVGEDDLIDRIRDCWASLFTPRAIYYRAEQGFGDVEVNMAVVVQKMVQADVSGVLFTRHPSTGDARMVIEAAWGLGEAIVSGTVSPDTYVIDAESGNLLDETIATKRTMVIRDDQGQTAEMTVPEDRQTARVLDGADLERLREVGTRIERHYEQPQDIEWALEGGQLYILQSRPITTISDEEADHAADTAAHDEALLTGIGASPGETTGPVRIVEQIDEIDKVQEGDILVTEMTMPDMVPAMKRARAIITDEGGMTSHASIVSRELGVPAVVGTSTATAVLEDGQQVTVDGELGAVFPPRDREATPEPDTAQPQVSPTKPMTGTRVLANVSIPDAAERAAATGADGVGLLRLEHLVLSLGRTPERYIADEGEEAYTDELVRGIRAVAEAFYPRPVRVRTLDAPTDEFRQLVGGDKEPDEHNPMLGFRGIRRSLDRPEPFNAELAAFRRLYEKGYDNIELMLPVVTQVREVEEAKTLMADAGIDLDRRSWGVMIETPASAIRSEALMETGIDFVSFGTNDLTQYTLAVDRNNEDVAPIFDELHPAVLDLIERTLAACDTYDVSSSICGHAGSNPRMVQFLVERGVSSISVNIDAVHPVQEEVKRVEQRLLLDGVR